MSQSQHGSFTPAPETVDQAIAYLLAQHAAEVAALPPEPTITYSMSGKPIKAIKAKRVDAKAPIHGQAAGRGMGPAIEKIDGRGFFMATRQAGKRPNEKGVMTLVSPALRREDIITAITAFIGWDPNRSYGEQLLQAESQARRDIQGAPKAAEYSRMGVKPPTTYTNAVAGTVDIKRKRLLDLHAKAIVTAEERDGFEKEGNVILAALKQAELDAINGVMLALETEGG